MPDIIPAYNEDKNIYRGVRSVKDCSEQFDIVVINDGSNAENDENLFKVNLKLNR